MCIVCRERAAKRTLTRIVRAPERDVTIDPSGKRNGRGAYLCDRKACWDKALVSGSLARALNVELNEETLETLREFAAKLPEPDSRPNQPNTSEERLTHDE
jgi:predicted RNA-binding protein YlxR (DUF448 family)